MSLLVPDYSSSSDDEREDRAPTPASTAVVGGPPLNDSRESAPAPASTTASALALPQPQNGITSVDSCAKTQRQTKKRKKVKTALFLPPEIQRLLESGGALEDSDDDDHEPNDTSLLAKQKQIKRQRAVAMTITNATSTPDALSFLPPPKHSVAGAKSNVGISGVNRSEQSPSQSVVSYNNNHDEQHAVASAPSVAPASSPIHQTSSYDPQQYAQHYQYYQQVQKPMGDDGFVAYAQGYEHQNTGGKRARNRDRELERMLQRGEFAQVADQLVEVQGVAPDAWHAPIEQLQKGNASDIKVKADFYNTAAGTTVASVKPSRLQRQKHQLNQLAFDAKMREFELLDKKGAAIKTKRETHAKYGW